MIDNPRHQATGSLESNYQHYGNICEMARRSKYLSSLPPLPVHCVPLGKAKSLADMNHTLMYFYLQMATRPRCH